MTIVFVGIDLAKNVFAVQGVNPAGKPELVRPSVPRARPHELVALTRSWASANNTADKAVSRSAVCSVDTSSFDVVGRWVRKEGLARKENLNHR